MIGIVSKCPRNLAFLLCLLVFARFSLALVLSPMPTQPAIYRRQEEEGNVKTVDQSGVEVGSAEDVDYDSTTTILVTQTVDADGASSTSGGGSNDDEGGGNSKQIWIIVGSCGGVLVLAIAAFIVYRKQTDTSFEGLNALFGMSNSPDPQRMRDYPDNASNSSRAGLMGQAAPFGHDYGNPFGGATGGMPQEPPMQQIGAPYQQPFVQPGQPIAYAQPAAESVHGLQQQSYPTSYASSTSEDYPQEMYPAESAFAPDAYHGHDRPPSPTKTNWMGSAAGTSISRNLGPDGMPLHKSRKLPKIGITPVDGGSMKSFGSESNSRAGSQRTGPSSRYMMGRGSGASGSQSQVSGRTGGTGATRRTDKTYQSSPTSYYSDESGQPSQFSRSTKASKLSKSGFTARSTRRAYTASPSDARSSPSTRYVDNDDFQSGFGESEGSFMTERSNLSARSKRNNLHKATLEMQHLNPSGYSSAAGKQFNPSSAFSSSIARAREVDLEDLPSTSGIPSAFEPPPETEVSMNRDAYGDEYSGTGSQYSRSTRRTTQSKKSKPTLLPAGTVVGSSVLMGGSSDVPAGRTPLTAEALSSLGGASQSGSQAGDFMKPRKRSQV